MNTTNEDLQNKYRHALAEKESALALLAEARYLLEIKDEHIALLEQKAALARTLQSELDNSSVEAETLQLKLMQQQKKAEAGKVLKTELEDELVASVEVEKNYLNLRDTHTHTSNELVMLHAELKELLELNKELLRELEKMGQLRAQAEILQQENEELKKRWGG